MLDRAPPAARTPEEDILYFRFRFAAAGRLRKRKKIRPDTAKDGRPSKTTAILAIGGMPRVEARRKRESPFQQQNRISYSACFRTNSVLRGADKCMTTYAAH